MVFSRFDRPEIEATPEAAACIGLRHLPSTLFSSMHARPTIPAESLRRILRPVRWATFTRASELNCMGATKLLVSMSEQNEWALADKAWLTLLCSAGDIIRKRGSDRWLMVLFSSAFAFAAWPLKAAESSLLVPDASDAATVQWSYTIDFADWEVAGGSVMAPMSIVCKVDGEKQATGESKIGFFASGTPPVIQASARRGFKELTSGFLSKLAQLLDLGWDRMEKGERPRTVEEKTSLLFDALIPNATREEHISALLARTSAPPEAPSSLGDPPAWACDGIFDNFDLTRVKESAGGKPEPSKAEARMREFVHGSRP